jgi:hypothetical protein
VLHHALPFPAELEIIHAYIVEVEKIQDAKIAKCCSRDAQIITNFLSWCRECLPSYEHDERCADLLRLLVGTRVWIAGERYSPIGALKSRERRILCLRDVLKIKKDSLWKVV